MPTQERANIFLYTGVAALLLTCILNSIVISSRNETIIHLTRDSCESACGRRGIAEPEAFFVRDAHCYCSDGTRLRMDVGSMWLDE